MISIFENIDDIHESIVGLGVMVAGLYLGYLYIKNSKVLDDIEDELVNSYEDSYLSVGVELDPDRPLKFLDKIYFTVPGKLRNKLIDGEKLALVVNRPTLIYLKQKFGKYPIFKMLGTDSKKTFTQEEFYNSHKKLYGLFGSKLEKGLFKSNNPKILANGTYLTLAIQALLKDLSSSIESITFTSKKVNVSYNVSI